MTGKEILPNLKICKNKNSFKKKLKLICRFLCIGLWPHCCFISTWGRCSFLRVNECMHSQSCFKTVINRIVDYTNKKLQNKKRSHQTTSAWSSATNYTVHLQYMTKSSCIACNIHVKRHYMYMENVKVSVMTECIYWGLWFSHRKPGNVTIAQLLPFTLPLIV